MDEVRPNSYSIEADFGKCFENDVPRPGIFYVYIGGNVFHEDRENGVDLKTIRDVVVSQNVFYGYERSETSVGDAIVVGSNGYDPQQGFGPDNVWILLNQIRESRSVTTRAISSGMSATKERIPASTWSTGTPA